MKVKLEGLPTRCEVCHQADLYVADDNYCARCDEVRQQTIKRVQFNGLFASGFSRILCKWLYGILATVGGGIGISYSLSWVIYIFSLCTIPLNITFISILAFTCPLIIWRTIQSDDPALTTFFVKFSIPSIFVSLVMFTMLSLLPVPQEYPPIISSTLPFILSCTLFAINILFNLKLSTADDKKSK